MIFGICRIFKLAGHKRAGSLGCKRLCLPDSTQHAFIVGGARHVRAQRAHDDDFLFRESFGYEERDFVSAIHADERESDTSVARRGLDDCPARRETSVALGLPNNADCSAIFNAAAGIQVHEFGENFASAYRLKTPQVEHGRLSNQFSDVFGNAQAGAG